MSILNGYVPTDQSITVIIDGKPHAVDLNMHVVAELRDVLASTPMGVDTDLTDLLALLDPAASLASALDGAPVDVNLVTGQVTYKGKRIAGHLEKRLLQIVNLGLPIDPWKRFVQRVMANPSETARKELNLFMEAADLPITEDGCFLAYKKIRFNYTDIHSGQFDNHVGQVVQMPRNEVDDDRNRTCSAGLHFCSESYLKHFGSASDVRIVIVKIDPADVVAIPSDYSNAKGRTWKYEVVQELESAGTRKARADAEAATKAAEAAAERAADESARQAAQEALNAAEAEQAKLDAEKLRTATLEGVVIDKSVPTNGVIEDEDTWDSQEIDTDEGREVAPTPEPVVVNRDAFVRASKPTNSFWKRAKNFLS